MCENGARCAAGECICPESCPEESGKTVCGTDGKTYQSECELQRIACDRDKIKELPLHVAFHGECGEKFAVAALSKFLFLFNPSFIYLIYGFNYNDVLYLLQGEKIMWEIIVDF